MAFARFCRSAIIRVTQPQQRYSKLQQGNEQLTVYLNDFETKSCWERQEDDDEHSIDSFSTAPTD